MTEKLAYEMISRILRTCSHLQAPDTASKLCAEWEEAVKCILECKEKAS